MQFHSGKGGTVTIGGTELPITEWSVDPSVEIQRFHNSKTGDFAVKEGTFKDCPFTITLDFDLDENPFQTPITVQAGEEISTVKLILPPDAATGKFWLFPVAVVVGTPQSLAVEGKITTTINCENSGTFSYPA